ELAAEGRRRLRPMGSEVLETLAPAARHDDRERAAGQAADIASGGGSRGLSGHGGAKGFEIGGAGTKPQEARSRKDLVLQPRSWAAVRATSSGRAHSDERAARARDRCALRWRTGRTAWARHRARTRRIHRTAPRRSA